MTADVLVSIRECEVCKAAIRIVGSEQDERQTAFDVASGEEHECFDVPETAELLVMDDDPCDCGGD